jgi:hypothetical protein
MTTRAATITNALLQSMRFRTDATELGVEWRILVARIRNAVLQSMCFATDVAELGFSGAVGLPFEEVASCDGGRCGPAIQALCWLHAQLVEVATRAATRINALPQSMRFRTGATELGFEWRTADIRNALLQRLCFTTGATELGFSGAAGLPFEVMAPCDGGRGGPAIKALCWQQTQLVEFPRTLQFAERNTRGRVNYTQCLGNRKTIDPTLPRLISLWLFLYHEIRAVHVAAHTWAKKGSGSKAQQ